MTVAPPMGATDQQDLAEEIYRLMVAQGAMFALDAPIRQSLTNLASFFARHQQHDEATVAAAIDAALSADARFTRELVGGEVRFVTSRQGSYIPRDDRDTHSFKQRLQDPDRPLPIDDISVVVSTSRPAITTVEPVFISDYWQIQAGIVMSEAEANRVAPVPVVEPVAAPETIVAPEVVTTPELVVAPELVVTPEEVSTPEVVVTPEIIVTPEPVVTPQPVAAREVIVTPEPVVIPEPVAPVVVPSRPARPIQERGTVLTLADGTSIDLRQSVDTLMAEHGDLLKRILSERIEQDPLRRIVSFGSRYFPEANIINLGKNDLRKIRDYILERGEPLLDSELIADVFYHNTRQSDYEAWRFSVNYRLYREKDFEFVGVEGANLWSTKGMPAIGGKRVKAAEMGQITSYLVEGYDDSLEQQSPEAIAQSGSVTILLNFFAWEYGVLPLDAGLQALLPNPVLHEQRTAVLRFDSPQHYTTSLVEVRYPTGNRGGWIQGLEEFFHEHLVPGALITISRGPEPNLFTIVYEEAEATTDRILTLDEKKNKLGFANVTFYAAVDTDQLPSQQRFGRLNRLKSFPMGERRKAEMILEHVAETMGDQVGRREAPSYAVSIDDLFMAYNVLRPGSRKLLQALIAQNDQFEPDPLKPGRFLYTPTVGVAAAEEEEEESTIQEPTAGRQPTRRRYGGRYTDDDE